MINVSFESQRKHVLEEAKEWWDTLNKIEKNQQIKQGKLFDSDEARRV